MILIINTAIVNSYKHKNSHSKSKFTLCVCLLLFQELLLAKVKDKILVIFYVIPLLGTICTILKT